jgi:hypothetical protein
MPPQQPDRLLDVTDNAFDFCAHDEQRFNGCRRTTQCARRLDQDSLSGRTADAAR